MNEKIVENTLPTIRPDASSVFDRREPRFFVAPDQRLACELRLPDDESTDLRGHVVNISTHGVQVKTESTLSEGQFFVLKLSIPDYSNDVELSGEVRSAALTSDRCYYLGCCFHEAVDDRLLTHLASLGMLERRVDDRVETRIDATVQQPLSDSKSVQIVEFSKGGLSFTSSAPTDLENRVKITFSDTGESIILTPIWQLEKLGEYRTGCAFNNNHNYSLVSKRVASNEAQSLLSRRRIPWMVVSIFVVAAWAVFKVLGF